MITQLRTISIPLAAILVISACASGMSKDECQLADWQAIGYEDGLQGWPETRVSTHRKACAQHGMAADSRAYRAGWDEGVGRYCQPGNGYRQGRSGNHYAGVCPADLEPAFLHAYGHGRELYDMEASLRRTERTLRHKRNRLSQIETQIRDNGLELVAADTSIERRVVLVDEIRRLEKEHSNTKAAIPPLESKLEEQRQRLAILSAESQY